MHETYSVSKGYFLKNIVDIVEILFLHDLILCRY